MSEEISSKILQIWKGQWLLLWALVCLILTPLSPFLATRAWIIALVWSVIFLLTKNGVGLIHQINRAWDSVFFIFILTVGSLYSTDLSACFRTLETASSFLVIPIIFSSINDFNEKKMKTMIRCFIGGLIIACTICIANAIFQYYETGETSVFLSYQLTSIINSHPTYLAYYLIFAITFILYRLYYRDENPKQITVVFIVSFFFLILMLTGGQTTFIAMLLVLSFFIMKFLIDDKTNERKIVFALSSLMIVGMFFSSRAVTDGRDAVLTDSWERFILWESALKANPNYLLGVGTGDYKDVLNQYYIDHNLTEYAQESYNSHNQFIQILFTNGMLGLVAVIILIARPIYLSVKYNDVLGTLIFFPFLIYGMTEVFLGRYQGVVFLAILHQMFVSFYLSHKLESSSLTAV